MGREREGKKMEEKKRVARDTERRGGKEGCGKE